MSPVTTGRLYHFRSAGTTDHGALSVKALSGTACEPATSEFSRPEGCHNGTRARLRLPPTSES
jgi:hypothetical protein